MKKLLGIMVLGLLLVGCAAGIDTTSYEGYRSSTSDHTYHAMACPASDPEVNFNCGLARSVVSQYETNQKALEVCARAYSDCVITKEGTKTVYTKEDSSRVQMATIIEDSKNTCKTLGFQEGTSKFTDCALKLYTQKIELAEKQNQQVVVQNQGSSTVRVIDVTREDENYRRKAMGLINGTCTLATYYGC